MLLRPATGAGGAQLSPRAHAASFGFARRLLLGTADCLWAFVWHSVARLAIITPPHAALSLFTQ